MYRKINIKILIVIFAVLLVAVILIEVADLKKGNRTFRSDLVEVNTDDVTSIELYPKITAGEKIRLFKENDFWKVESGGESYAADQSISGTLISALNNMTPESVVATNKDRWSTFEVTDSLGTRVKLFNGENLLADVVIGKFSFSQPRNMTSYVRLADEKDVYGVNGMIGMTFNRDLKSFRDKTVIKSASSNWTKLTFSYPADSSFVMEKINEKWMINGQAADSASVVKYFNSISSLNEGRYADSKPVAALTHQLKIEGNNMMEPIDITGYKVDDENFIIASNQNRGTYFNSPDLAKKVFVSFSKFIN